MKKVILVLALFAIAFAFSACSDSTLTGVDEKQVSNQYTPFKGNFDGIAITIGGIPPYYLQKKLTVQGNSTHLGNFNSDVYYDVYITSATTGIINNGSAIMVAANGDQLNLTDLVGTFTFNAPAPVADKVTFDLQGNIEGGTGRFVNAEGEFTGSGYQIFDYNVDPTPTFYTWNGTITY